MLVCVMGFQGTEISLGQSDHPLLLVHPHLDHPHPPLLQCLLGLFNLLSTSWAHDCISAVLSQSLVEIWVFPLQSVHSGCGLVSLGNIATQSSSRGLEWLPLEPHWCCQREGSGSVPPVLCHLVQTCSAQCLSTWCCRWAWSTHLAAALTPLWLLSPFSLPGFGSSLLPVDAGGSAGSCWRPTEQMSQAFAIFFF